MRAFPFHLVARTVLLATVVTVPASAAGDPNKGAQVFGACAGCPSLDPGRHLTGPSLHDVVGRKPGTAAGFVRYSEALQRSGVVWGEKTLDAWLANPQALVPGNLMTFLGHQGPAVARASHRLPAQR